MFFFFKQKTAYEMRISDWSSDVCSSDLLGLGARVFRLPGIYGPGRSPLDRVRAGNAHRVVAPGQVFSRIHVDDIASGVIAAFDGPSGARSEEHTSELQSLMRISYAVFCLKKKKIQ